MQNKLDKRLPNVKIPSYTLLIYLLKHSQYYEKGIENNQNDKTSGMTLQLFPQFTLTVSPDHAVLFLFLQITFKIINHTYFSICSF